MGSSVPLSTRPEGKEREAQKKRTGAGSRLRGRLREEIGRLKTWANEGLRRRSLPEKSPRWNRHGEGGRGEIPQQEADGLSVGSAGNEACSRKRVLGAGLRAGERPDIWIGHFGGFKKKQQTQLSPPGVGRALVRTRFTHAAAGEKDQGQDWASGLGRRPREDKAVAGGVVWKEGAGTLSERPSMDSGLGRGQNEGDT